MITSTRPWTRARLSKRPFVSRRWLSQSALDRLAEPVQSYISTSRDPYLNLSIEHHLLQKSAPESAVLLLYINRPSIIIGRNQNPWVEANLALLDPARHNHPETEPPSLGVVDLVRRRSGGGTVFHDEGNVNWTVITQPKDFTRDKHAEMVVRALRSCGVDRSRVNERHDIVLDQGARAIEARSADTHSTPYMSDSGNPRPLKVSGSAYKLTRQRALHHGTCLLSSPNLNVIPDYLHSPAKPFISARGVESVSSPVGNILLESDRFISTVQEQFAQLYGVSNKPEAVDEAWLEHNAIRKGYDEMRSLEWTYLQTPQFTVSNASDKEARMHFELSVRNGAINGGFAYEVGEEQHKIDISPSTIGQRLHEIQDFDSFVSRAFPTLGALESHQLSAWLHRMLPSPTYFTEKEKSS
ncbi:hypothetical protein KC363_g7081 [Hortaea werneckii]|uniref:Putative lipoate-protein ligase A n=1 Tax=Hortaea werneckii TaxID=91943 RepID=A0A3M7FC06_HORWE|nr:hypothetical protein KC325_g2622 [Hortaea werneckii]KAI6996765.1 hypothetical protein KC359_g3354 [Hortaea werneckii]KAI7148013.1 hypothetical protein KC344_g2341 [Hortaea werneckii]KAI7177519.1 hypothetical protein KC360_g2304 [Hortaea werneckii]KAI7185556.1 hypothetical protein KC363_g7081 [Hortaea werneckii]